MAILFSTECNTLPWQCAPQLYGSDLGGEGPLLLHEKKQRDRKPALQKNNLLDHHCSGDCLTTGERDPPTSEQC